MSESRPYSKNLMVTSKVNFKRPTLIDFYIYSDETSETAPLARNDNVKALCAAEADISHIPVEQIPTSEGADGLMYYVVSFHIEIACEFGTHTSLRHRDPVEDRTC